MKKKKKNKKIKNEEKEENIKRGLKSDEPS